MPVGQLDLMPIIETAAGVESAKEIATTNSRIRRMAFGGGDYTLDLNYEWNADEAVLAYARAKLSHAARLGDLEPPIDTVVLQIRDDDRFMQSARYGKQFGFGGKLCIHPSQVPLTHDVFTPSADEIAHARAVVAAFKRLRQPVWPPSSSMAILSITPSSIRASGFWRWQQDCRRSALRGAEDCAKRSAKWLGPAPQRIMT